MAGDPSGLEVGLEALARIVVSVDASRDSTMVKIAELACGLLEGCDLVSVTMLERGRPETVGATDDDALAVDLAQYESRSGPCLAAIHDERIVRVPSLPDAGSAWGATVASTAAARSIASSLSAPLVVHETCVGGLNLYSRRLDAFAVADESTLASFADQAAVVATNARDYWALSETTQQLQSALESRAVIEQAKGVLMAREGCSPDEAFDVLRRASQRNNRKLRQIAAEIVAGTQQATEDGHA
jgi:GAF domain-containing protein